MRYIWTHTRPQQFWLLAVVLISMVPYFLAFDLPRQIINGPIQGGGFEAADATQPFMRLVVTLPFLGSTVLFPGVEIGRGSMLVALSLTFLGLVIVNGLFKLYINTYKGRLGERLLRRIRYELVDRMLRFPPANLRRMKPAEIASMVKDEVEPLGGFSGDAFVQPALLGAQALAALAFIMVQNVWLGLIAAVMATIQIGIIPRMRRRLITLGRQRQLTARQLSGRVSELAEGVGAIRAFDTSNYERADVADRLGRIFRIRYDLYQWKFLVKFINNFLAQLTPFLFYLIGGWLTISGSLDVGQLVAVINAYRDLPGPLKELIDWDQARQDVQVKYEQVVDQFRSDGLLPPEAQALTRGNGQPVLPLEVRDLTINDDAGTALLARATLRVGDGETIALVNENGSDAETMTAAIGRMFWPDGGRITAGGQDLLDLPDAVSGRAITYIAEESYFFQGTLRDNLLYGLKHAPGEGATAQDRAWQIREARAAGNPDYDVHADWVDYALVNRGGADLMEPVIEALTAVQMRADVIQFALQSPLDPAAKPELAARLVELRTALRARLTEEGTSGLVLPFDPEAYNSEATILENLLFGVIASDADARRLIADTATLRAIVDDSGTAAMLFDLGREAARNFVEIFGDLPADHELFNDMPFTAGDVARLRTTLARVGDAAFAESAAAHQRELIQLSFHYIEPRYRFELLTPGIMARIVETRHRLLGELPSVPELGVEPYDPARYIGSASLLDNIVFGKIGRDSHDARARVRATVTALLDERGLIREIIALGLDYDVGTGGRRLAFQQRQKLNLARGLLRRSDLYVFNRPLSGVDRRSQAAIVANVLRLLRDGAERRSIVWALSSPALAAHFDRVVVFGDGKLADDAPFAALSGKYPMLEAAAQ